MATNPLEANDLIKWVNRFYRYGESFIFSEDREEAKVALEEIKQRLEGGYNDN